MTVARGSGHLVTASREPTPAERVAVSRLVLRNARSRADLRLLLDALGLTTTSKEDAQ